MGCRCCRNDKNTAAIVVASSMAAMLPIWVVAVTNDDSGAQPEQRPAVASAAEEDPRDMLVFEMQGIEGETRDLADYRGDVLLIVNVASRCGYTRQYEGLEKLYRERKDRGFKVLGFPANDFGRQEPGTDEEILEFCTSRFEVTFPMFSKIAVTGEDAHPLYKKLAALPEPIGGEPKWNFTKYLLDRDGRVVARFEPGVKPDDTTMVSKIDELLGSGDDGTPGGG